MIVSRETEVLLAQYQDLALRWNEKINLFAKAEAAEFRQRHIQDSLQLLDICPRDSGIWLDLGSGGGLPGVVIAIAQRGTGLSVTLVESDQRKVAFLKTVKRELGLDQLTIICERIEQLKPIRADFISARALASLVQLLGYARPHSHENTIALFPKGRSWRKEVEEARLSWQFDCAEAKSQTDDEAAILKISGYYPK